jgi:hypothetical protein
MQSHYHVFRSTLGSALCVLLCALPSAHAEELQPQEIRDLRYGEVLFNFYQKKYFSAITNLLVADQVRPLEMQGADPKLLLGGLYLTYGMHDQASKIFDDVLSSNTLPATHDRAWYYIAKLRYLKGYLPEAEQALLKIQQTLPPDREAERYHFLANVYLANQQYDKAIEVLRNFKGDVEWQAYAQFNLGVALIKAGKTDDGIGLLAKVGDLDPVKINYELNALRDKANLALGFALMRDNKAEAAEKYFARVRLQGPLSNKALLGMGWSATSQNQYKKALIPWMELQTRNTLDTSVQESLLAIPYTMEKLEKPRLALQQYQKAIEAYSAEITQMGSIIKAVQNGELAQAMRPANYDDETSLPVHTFGLPKSVTSPYLHQLMATHAFQEAYKDYQNLYFLQYTLQHWRRQLPSYVLMLSERRRAYFEKLPQVASDDRLQQIGHMEEERNKLVAELQRIETDDDVFALTTDDEQGHIDSLNRLKAKYGAPAAATAQPSAEQERYRMVYGILYWQLHQDFPTRVYEVKKRVKELDKAISDVKKTKIRLITAANNAPKHFQGHDVRIRAANQHIDVLLKQLDNAIAEQQRYIQTLALLALQQRNQQLESYHIRARFSVARLYDALTKDKEAGRAQE